LNKTLIIHPDISKRTKILMKLSIQSIFEQDCRDDRILDFYYLILSCFWKMISVSDLNPVLVEITLSISENYPKVFYDAQHTLLCFVYFALWGKNNCWSYFAFS